jgi:hypothetical protein
VDFCPSIQLKIMLGLGRCCLFGPGSTWTSSQILYPRRWSFLDQVLSVLLTFTKKGVRRHPPHNALRSRERWYVCMRHSTFRISFTSTFERTIYHVPTSQRDGDLGPVCGRCLQCFSSWSISFTLRDWGVVPAGARFLRTNAHISRYADRADPPSLTTISAII